MIKETKSKSTANLPKQTVLYKRRFLSVKYSIIKRNLIQQQIERRFFIIDRIFQIMC